MASLADAQRMPEDFDGHPADTSGVVGSCCPLRPAVMPIAPFKAGEGFRRTWAYREEREAAVAARP